jgi:hypothetical protein
MTGGNIRNNELFVYQVVHKAFVEVNEEGWGYCSYCGMYGGLCHAFRASGFQIYMW